MKICAGDLLDIPKIKSVVADPTSSDNRLVLLNPARVSSLDLSELGPDRLAHLAALHVAAVAVPHVVHMSYEHASLEEVLRALLPADAGQPPSAFETAGHVAHLNLRDALLPYKHAIGQAILDKNPHIHTVVNKTGVINAQFRTFPMEVLAGPDETIVEVREGGARFRFDFREVYWNSRLGREHDYIASGAGGAIPPGSIVADMFCGVGPFAIPLALRGCTLYANDLNPASFKALVDNVALNRVRASVTPFNLDARDFIVRMVRKERRRVGHILMNLPASAIEFTDVFVGLYAEEDITASALSPSSTSSSSSTSASSDSAVLNSSSHAHAPALSSLPLPRVYVYCFSKSGDKEEAAQDVTRRLVDRLQLVWLSNSDNSSSSGAVGGPNDLSTSSSFVDSTAGVIPPATLSTSSSLSSSAVAATIPASSAARGIAALEDCSAADSEGTSAAASFVQTVKQRWLPDLEVRPVRDVAPQKLMMCISFTLPEFVARCALGSASGILSVAESARGTGEPTAKRPRPAER